VSRRRRCGDGSRAEEALHRMRSGYFLPVGTVVNGSPPCAHEGRDQPDWTQEQCCGERGEGKTRLPSFFQSSRYFKHLMP
jgi:hypothetical protein